MVEAGLPTPVIRSRPDLLSPRRYSATPLPHSGAYSFLPRPMSHRISRQPPPKPTSTSSGERSIAYLHRCSLIRQPYPARMSCHVRDTAAIAAVGKASKRGRNRKRRSPSSVGCETLCICTPRYAYRRVSRTRFQVGGHTLSPNARSQRLCWRILMGGMLLIDMSERVSQLTYR